MNKVKKRYVSVVLFIMIALGIWFILLDFSRFFNYNYSYDIFPSAILKRINVILSASIVWFAGGDGFNPRDSRIMKAAFMFICLGEAAFAIGERMYGIGMFAVCQTLLIMRNGTGLICKLAHASHKQKKALLALSIKISLIPVLFVVLFSSLFRLGSTTAAVMLYAFVLSISLWTGITNSMLHLFPALNSKMTVAGMVCFYCCDVLVGLDAALEVGLIWLLANSFIWVFYIPALVLLALSCYRYDKPSVKY